MAYARQPGAPHVSATPLESLEPRPYDPNSHFEEYALPVLGGLLGFVGPSVLNYHFRRPLYSGFWINIAAGFGMTWAGYKIRDLRRNIAALKDETLRQYIMLHPEDFPPYEKKLFRDVIRPWDPIR